MRRLVVLPSRAEYPRRLVRRNYHHALLERRCRARTRTRVHKLGRADTRARTRTCTRVRAGNRGGTGVRACAARAYEEDGDAAPAEEGAKEEAAPAEPPKAEETAAAEPAAEA